jgi:choice-of-anchor B domain-containing protein
MRVLLLVLVAGIASVALKAQDSLHMNKLGQLTYNSILNDVWGYADGNGNEYALVGSMTGFSIVDVTDPTNPIEKQSIPGSAFSTWRDIKTFSHYAYIVHDGFAGASDGILIVDMDSVNQPVARFKNHFPTDTIFGAPMNYLASHNIYIDDNGILHVYGAGGIGVGGALFFDLNADPWNPKFVGAFDEYYLHDGMARGDTLWGGAIFNGFMVAVDISDKANPTSIGFVNTPDAFTHNSWVSDDGKTVFTTDEVSGAYVAAYDVSDVSNIVEQGRVKISYGGPDVVPHNAHVYGDFVVTSYYTSGVQVVDATLPNAMVETAYYDTSLDTGTGFTGAWGAYPYLPSGNVLVTDREQGLFVLSCDYPKACYLTGLVKDSVTGSGIPAASIEILNGSPALQGDIFGNYATAIRDAGTYQVVFSKPAYKSDTLTLNFSNGIELKRTVALLPVTFSLEEELTVQPSLSPNPGRDYFNLELDERQLGGMSTLQIFNINGELVKELTIDLSEPKHRVEHQLKAGSYMIHILTEDFKVEPMKLLVIE